MLFLDVTLYEGDAKTVERLYELQDEQNRRTISEWEEQKQTKARLKRQNNQNTKGQK